MHGRPDASLRCAIDRSRPRLPKRDNGDGRVAPRRRYFVGLFGDFQGVVCFRFGIETKNRIVQHNSDANGMISRKIGLRQLFRIQITMIRLVLQTVAKVRRGDFDFITKKVAFHSFVKGDLFGIVASVRCENVLDDR